VHELAIANAILAVAEGHAEGRPVSVVRAKLGRLRQVVPESLAFYFEIAGRGTLCDGAALEWERVPSLLRCGACGAEWDPAPPAAHERAERIIAFRCPACAGSDHQVVSGDELIVESIDVEESAPAPAHAMES
jgi:hydrogenase nickel incorporation protein HypA/HybF